MSQIGSGAPNKEYWRSIGELEQSSEFKEYVDREFPKDASVLEDEVSRRTFMKIMGASFAFAGLSGCVGFQRPKQAVRPYARTPENLIPGRPNYYATSMVLGTDVVGLLVENHEGRPTKIEGNPSHPGSLGATNAIHQASVLELYDPDRLKRIECNIPSVDFDQYGTWLSERIQEAKASGGARVAFLIDTNVSPTLDRSLGALSAAYTHSRVFQYAAVNDDHAVQGIRSITGKGLRSVVHYDRLDRIVAFGADFLGAESGNVVNAKAFSSRRDPESERGMNRLYMFESHFTVTGGKADHRYRIQPGQMDAAIAQIATAIFGRVGNVSADVQSKVAEWSKKLGSVVPSAVVSAIVEDLASSSLVSAMVVGDHVSPFGHAVAYAVNSAINATAGGISYYPLSFESSVYAQSGSMASIKALTGLISRGEIDTLFILGGNPVFTAPSDVAFEAALKKLKHSVHLTVSANETSERVQWVVPRAHYLESWGDARAIDGTVSLVQPLIQPLYKGVSDIEWVNYFLTGVPSEGYAEVRATQMASGASEKAWRRWLHEGVVSLSGSSVTLPVQQLVVSPVVAKGMQVEFATDFKVFDGRFTNNGWLQELPHPVTKLTWDNAALVGVDTAAKLGIKTGDVVTLTAVTGEIEVAVLVQPGTADDTIILALGYGRRVDGRIGQGAGFDVYPLRSTVTPSFVGDVKVAKTGKTYTLASTQEHGSMEGRGLVQSAPLATFEEDPKFAQHRHENAPPLKSSWPEIAYDTGNQWGMSIDLSKCTGCNACLIACQSENNIPIVGKREVANGREMHWIRLDRYYEGEANDPQMVQQPMTCLQCENAPCEQVCPVAATTHTTEGLNDMAYNRCIGTKYCSNNCPVKVRRFNFFDYHQRNPQSVQKDRVHFFDYFREPDKTVQMQFNPDVSLRMRGVMEKCTYCVQRIQQGKIRSKNEGRAIVDGEIQSACMQSCPSDAIVFGNILDPESRIAKLKKNPRDYQILSELHLKARTTYLASVRNPHPKLVEERA